MVSKYDHCLHDLLLRQRSGELRCELPLIVSNHDLRDVAHAYGVPLCLRSSAASRITRHTGVA